jgi:hypothetical protein
MPNSAKKVDKNGHIRKKFRKARSDKDIQNIKNGLIVKKTFNFLGILRGKILNF